MSGFAQDAKQDSTEKQTAEEFKKDSSPFRMLKLSDGSTLFDGNAITYKDRSILAPFDKSKLRK